MTELKREGRLLVWSTGGDREPRVVSGIAGFEKAVIFGIRGPEFAMAAADYLYGDRDDADWVTARDWCLFSVYEPEKALPEIGSGCVDAEEPMLLFPAESAPVAEIELFREVDAAVALAACRAEAAGIVAVRGDVVARSWPKPSPVPLDLARRLTLDAVGASGDVDSTLPLGEAVSVGEWPAEAPPRAESLPELGEATRSARDFEREFVDGLDTGDLVRAGLLLIHGDLDGAHRIAQEREGNVTADYLHAIVHRREGDYGNAAYWFRRAQRHPVLAKLARDGVATGEPFAFLDICRRHAGDGSPQERLAREAQWAEMLALLTYTAGETV